MLFQLTESNRQGLSGTAVVMALIVVGSAVAFGCSDGSQKAAVRVTDETPVRPASTVADVPVRQPPVSDAPAVGATTTSEARSPKTVIPENVSFADGEVAYQARDYQLATALFGAYVERKPDNAWGHFMLGLSARKAGSLDVAVSSFEEALAIDPGHVRSYFNLGRTLLDGGNPEQALVAFESGVELSPESGEGYRLLGRAYQRLGDTEAAVASYHEALVLDGDDPWSMNNLALILIEGGRSEDAIGPLARAVQIRDDVAFIHNNLGIALEAAGHPDQAATTYRDALSVDPDYSKAQVSLARVEGTTPSGSAPVDLEEAAREFVSNIERWRTPDVSEFVPDVLEEPLVRDTVFDGVGTWE